MREAVFASQKRRAPWLIFSFPQQQIKNKKQEKKRYFNIGLWYIYSNFEVKLKSQWKGQLACVLGVADIAS